MSIDRAVLKIGPAKLAHDGATHFFPDGLTLTVSRTFVDIGVDAFGDDMLKAHTDTTIEVSGTPKSWANMAKLNPFGAMAPGTLLCGATDKPLVITPVNGKPLTLAAACVKTPPNLVFSASKPMLGACTWAGVLANNVEWAAVGARYAWGTSASGVALTGLTPADMAFCPWVLELGGTVIEHEDGVAVDFSVAVTEQRTDSLGIVDWSFDGVSATAKYVPVVEEAAALDALAIQGAGAVRGKSAAAALLELTGSGTRYFSLAGCVQRATAGRYSRSLKRVGEVELVSTRSQTSGVLDALYTFAAS